MDELDSFSNIDTLTPSIRAGSDALHFQVPSMDSLQRTFLNHDQISEIKGASIMDGGVLKPVDMWISDSSRLSSISTTKKYISSLSIDVQVFDVGQNTAGLCPLRFQGRSGYGVSMRYGEILVAPTTPVG